MASYGQDDEFGSTPWDYSLVDDYAFGQNDPFLSSDQTIAPLRSPFSPLFSPPFTGPLAQAQLDSSDCVRSHTEISNASSGEPKAASRLFCPVESCTNKTGFERESDLNRHRTKHAKNHKCPEAGCGRPFGSRADMLRHRREVHAKDENDAQPSDFFCPFPSCKRSRKGFARYWNMMQHQKKMHSESGEASTSTATSPASLSSENDPLTPVSSNETGMPPPKRFPPPVWPLQSGDSSSGAVIKEYDELAMVGLRLEQLRSKRGKLDQNIEAYERLEDALRDDAA